MFFSLLLIKKFSFINVTQWVALSVRVLKKMFDKYMKRIIPLIKYAFRRTNLR